MVLDYTWNQCSSALSSIRISGFRQVGAVTFGCVCMEAKCWSESSASILTPDVSGRSTQGFSCHTSFAGKATTLKKSLNLNQFVETKWTWAEKKKIKVVEECLEQKAFYHLSLLLGVSHWPNKTWIYMSVFL